MVNISVLVYFKLKRAILKLKSIFFMILILVIILSGIIFAVIKTKAFVPKILVCNEDTSVIGGIMTGTVLNDNFEGAAEFKTSKLESGKKAVYSGKASCLIHIKKDTVSSLYEGKRVLIDLYVGDEENDFTKFITEYIKGFTEIINTSQNAGLLYMKILREKGMTDAEYAEKFEELQEEYIKKALLRDEIIKDIYGKGKTWKENYPLVFYAAGALIFVLLNSYFIKKDKETALLKERLILSGYSRKEILSANIFLLGLLNIIYMICFIFIGKLTGIG